MVELSLIILNGYDAGCCNDISDGKVWRGRSGRTTNRAALAFRLAEQAVSRTDTALGTFFRRMRAKQRKFVQSPKKVLRAA